MLEGLFCFASSRKQAERCRAANSRPVERGAERGERAGPVGPSAGLAAPAARTARAVPRLGPARQDPLPPAPAQTCGRSCRRCRWPALAEFPRGAARREAANLGRGRAPTRASSLLQGGGKKAPLGAGHTAGPLRACLGTYKSGLAFLCPLIQMQIGLFERRLPPLHDRYRS